MIKGDVLEIGQAFYGSFSGYHDYRILAASPAGASGFSREDREIISLRSNLGGSAQTASAFAPFFTFYELGRQRRWAFSRTVLLGRGPRGNDYLAQVLALSAEVMEALRGNPFLLLELDVELSLGLFKDAKPLSEEPLKPLYVPFEKVVTKSIRHGQLDSRISEPVAAGFLRTLTRRTVGTLSLSLDDGEAAVSLCKSIVSLLPPDDREVLSFCSRFSLPRRTSFRLAVYAAEDAPMAERYLIGLNTEVAQGSNDLWSDWISARMEVEPFYGVSLSNDTASRLLNILRKLDRGERLTLSEEEFLGPIALDPRNWRLPSVQKLLLPLAWKAVRDRAGEVVSAGSSISPLEKACQLAWSFADDEFLVTKINEAASHHGSRVDNIVEVTAILAMATLVPGRARPGSILATSEEPTLFRSGQLASWMLAMSDVNWGACRKLLSSWFVAWFRLVGPELLDPVLEELKRLKMQGPKAPVAAVTAFSALWDVKPEAEDLRFAWRTDLLRKGRERLGPSLLSDRDVGHLVLQERHLDQMQIDEAEALLRVTCRELPAETESWMETQAPDTRLLLAAARACTQGLAAIPPEQSWPDHDPRRWSLVARVANTLVRESRSQSLEAKKGEALALLLFSAAVVAPSSEVTSIAGAVKSTVEAGVQGGADLLLRAAVALANKGDRIAARAIVSAPVLKVHSEKSLEGSREEFWGTCMLAAAWRKMEACSK